MSETITPFPHMPARHVQGQLYDPFTLFWRVIIHHYHSCLSCQAHCATHRQNVSFLAVHM